MRLKLILGALLALILVVSLSGTATAGKKGGSTPIVAPSSNDPGDGGSCDGNCYPLFTGDCRLTGGLYNEGWYYMWPGNTRRDKCNSGWYTVEFWNGSSWYLAAYYD